MKIIAVIPAHLASVRFPRKILHPFYGLSMIEHVRRRALMSQAIDEVYVATCDAEIANEVVSHNGKVIMTSSRHQNGTSRVAEAVRDIECSHVLLLQGDEPLLLPSHLDEMAHAIKKTPQGLAWNATGPIEKSEELDRHSFVKCVSLHDDEISLCFRRTPFYSDFDIQKKIIRKILGIIAYEKEFLLQLSSLHAGLIEVTESIEQMRIIENGLKLLSVAVQPSLPSVNEFSEAAIINKYIENSEEQKALLAKVLEHRS